MADLNAITVANAPVSYGAFELTVGIDPSTPDGLRDIALCQAIIECHRTGGPVGRPTAPADTGEGRTAR